MTTILAGGVFDIWHEGHRYFLEEAKKLGDRLIVVVANDENVSKNIHNGQDARAEKVREQGIADEVIIGNAADFSRTVDTVKPDVIALGYDQENPVPENNIKVVKIDKFGEHSSTKLREQVKKSAAEA